MRFTKTYCPRPPYGRGRARPGHKYRMSENALAQRRRNLRTWRERGHLWRGYSESQAIWWLIWQWTFDPQPKLSGRALARKLGVWERYVRKVPNGAWRCGFRTDPVAHVDFLTSEFHRLVLAS